MLYAPEGAGVPAGDRLRPYFGMHRFAWPQGSVDVHIGHGEMLRLLP
jgi:hypothetical protein